MFAESEMLGVPLLVAYFYF